MSHYLKQSIPADSIDDSLQKRKARHCYQSESVHPSHRSVETTAQGKSEAAHYYKIDICTVQLGLLAAKTVEAFVCSRGYLLETLSLWRFGSSIGGSSCCQNTPDVIFWKRCFGSSVGCGSRAGVQSKRGPAADNQTDQSLTKDGQNRTGSSCVGVAFFWKRSCYGVLDLLVWHGPSCCQNRSDLLFFRLAIC